jgi:ATP-dependent Clp protease ATP-binding subunit ClpX
MGEFIMKKVNKIIIETLQDHNMCLYNIETKSVGAKYAFITEFNYENYWIASNDFKNYFIVDFKGNIISKENIYRISPINQIGIGIVQTKSNMFILVDKKLDILSQQYNLIKEFNGKDKWIASDGKYEFLIGPDGKRIDQKNYINIYPVGEEGEYGRVIDLNENIYLVNENLIPILDPPIFMEQPIDNKIEDSFNPKELIKNISQEIVGQEEAISNIVLNIWSNQKIFNTNNLNLIKTHKASMLIIGPSGTGKTEILKSIQKRIQNPIYVTDITQYTPTGYVGNDLNNIFISLLNMTDGNKDLAEKGIVCLDEIDKLGDYSKDNELAIKKGLQQELLPLISGTNIKIVYNKETINFNTNRITFIGSGAFESLRNEKKNKKLNIGFENQNQNQNQNNVNYDVEDFINFGLSKELIARFTYQIYLKSYTIEDFKNIMLYSKLSPLKMLQEYFKVIFDYEINYTEEFLNAIAFYAYNSHLEARGLQQRMNQIKIDLLKLTSNADTKYPKILLKSKEPTNEEEKKLIRMIN